MEDPDSVERLQQVTSGSAGGCMVDYNADDFDDGEEKEVADLSGPELEIMASLIAIAAKKKLQRT